MNEKVKNGLLTFLFGLLLLPLLQQHLPFITTAPLNGYYADTASVPLTPQRWFDGTYQQEEATFMNNNIGFRADLVRVNIQLDHSLFGKFHSDMFVDGIDHYLLQTIQINAYYGKDFVGYDTAAEKMRKLKAVQDTLARLGKSLVVVYAPCKAFFHPENIPPDMRSGKGSTNYETYKRLGDSLGINQVDMIAWFAGKRGTAEPLFTKQGIHWSVYGSLLAADTFVKYVERLRGIHMPHPQWSEVTRTTVPRYSDADLAQTLNLIWPIVTDTFSYPDVQYAGDVTSVKPKVTYIGDSFLETWIYDGLMDSTNSEWEVWSNFHIILDKQTAGNKPARVITADNWQVPLLRSDCIVLLNTSFKLYKFGNGFIEQAYAHFYAGK